ncbi:MAG: rhomboid family intramembrane serine protease [Corynebacterium sp.]|nr:rhomboid family intramembrane serine protease [Corynebacterium sp.]
MSSVQQRFQDAWRYMPATFVICALNIAAYFFTAAQSRSLSNNLSDSQLASDWVMYGPAVTIYGQWYRLLTSSFLHFGFGHLLMNMLLLIVLAYHLERALGSLAFAATYLVCAFGAGAAVYIFHPSTPTAGASGAIYGLMAFLVVQALISKFDVRAPLTLLLVNIGYTFTLSGISVAGHLGGLVVGLMLAYPLLQAQRRRRWLYLLLMIFALSAAVFAF